MWEYITNNTWQLLIGLNYVLVVATAITILLKKINPTKTLAYLLALALMPFVGLVIYYLFGLEYKKSRVYKKKKILNQTNIKRWKDNFKHSIAGLDLEDQEILSDKLKLVKLLHASQEAPLTRNNKVSILLNGEQKFKALFNDISSAKHSIHLEYYIFKDDEIGTKLIDLLCEKAKQGVSVKLSYDYVGSSISFAAKRKLDLCGVESYAFMPVYFPKFTSKLNYRNHRKIAVIDGKIGYVGGINISDRYINNKQGKNCDNIFWRDTHLRIEGEAVGALQLNFLLNWDFVSDQDVKVEPHYFPEVEVTNKTEVQIVASGPDTNDAHIMEVIFTAITNANKSVYITTPYFIPNDEILFALHSAAKSGIEVKILIPKDSDSWVAKNATNSYIDKLLRSGVKFYFYTKGFIHAKMMIVDEIFTTIGTANMDYRSFNINFEINALVYDETFAKEALKVFTEDLKESELVHSSKWRKRSTMQQLQESFARLMAPLL